MRKKTIISISLIILFIILIILFVNKNISKTTVLINSSTCEVPFQSSFQSLEINVPNSNRKRDVAIWLPYKNNTLPNCGPYPIIIFSHGYNGCNTQSTYLTEKLAQQGYIIFAPNHDDALCVHEADVSVPPLNFFDKPNEWNETSFLERNITIHEVINLIESLNNNPESQFYSKLDLKNIGLMGHSLGGYTTLSISGARSSWYSNKIKASLVFAPYTRPLITEGNLNKIIIPLMIQGGERDTTITPYLPEVYNLVKGDKYYLELNNAGHLAWADISCLGKSTSNCVKDKPIQATIAEKTLEFFNAYLKQDKQALETLKTKNNEIITNLYQTT